MNQYKKRRHKLPKLIFIALLTVVYCIWALAKPITDLRPTTTSLRLNTTTTTGALAWPSQGQAAVGIHPSGVLATHGTQTPVPIASTTKVLTALAVLKKRPIPAGQTGPTITLTAADVAIYNAYVAKDGSVTPVEAGEKLTQYQMLQAVLLPSANNIADSLAIWAFGSLDNYFSFTNSYIRQLGLTNTRVGGDASGYDPRNVSTAHDLVLIGEAAMQEPVLAEIVGQSMADLPVAGRIMNVNALLGSNNIVGVKTGNTDQAGGVFIAAQKAVVSGKELLIVTAVAGTDTLYQAMIGSLPLLSSVRDNFAEVPVLAAGAIVGRYRQPWNNVDVTVVTAKPLTTVAWKGSVIPTMVTLGDIGSRAKKGQEVGKVAVPQSPVSTAQSVPLTISSSISQPSVWWRLTHPLYR